MLDALQRPMRDLRISVTDRCNLRCRYCMPREVFGPDHAFLPRGELLSFEEITRVATLSAAHGVDRIRLTGGEPLLRRELPRLVEMLVAVPGIDELSLTTNGLLLARGAAALAAAGLDRVTVSLDALRPETSARGCRRAARRGAGAGRHRRRPRRGARSRQGEHGRAPRAQRRRSAGDGRALPRQRMRAAVHRVHGRRHDERVAPEDVVPATEILELIGSRWPLEPLAPTRPGEVASRYRYRDGGGEIGVIHAVTVPFCHGCTRARLSADGKLFTCLFAAEGRDLRAPLRAGGSDRELSELIAGAWSGRRDRYSAERAAHHGPVPGAYRDVLHRGVARQGARRRQERGLGSSPCPSARRWSVSEQLLLQPHGFEGFRRVGVHFSPCQLAVAQREDHCQLHVDGQAGALGAPALAKDADDLVAACVIGA